MHCHHTQTDHADLHMAFKRNHCPVPHDTHGQSNKRALCVYCSPRFWYWESVVLVQTLGLAAAQVLANTLNVFFQLLIMLVILGFGLVALAYLHPLHQSEPQRNQVCRVTNQLP